VTRPEILIVGAGVIGCACARLLARAGARVLVVDRGLPGAEASNSSAGLLAPLAEAHEPGPFFDLLRLGSARFPPLVEALHAETGIDVEYRRDGLLEVALTHEEEAVLRARAAALARRGLAVEALEATEAAEREPALAAGVRFALYLPDDHRIDSVRLTQALYRSAALAGARFRIGVPVSRLLEDETGVDAGGERLLAGEVVIAAGAYSGLISGALPRADAVSPARGQIVVLETACHLLRRPVAQHPTAGAGAYLVPRDDGRLLVGATVEDAGFDRSVTASAILCRARPGVVIATGHFRNGILLAPITAEIVADLVGNRRPEVDVSPFAPSRFDAGEA
jgi:glycine oxidase